MNKPYHARNYKFCECPIGHASKRGRCLKCGDRTARQTTPCLDKNCQCNKK